MNSSQTNASLSLHKKPNKTENQLNRRSENKCIKIIIEQFYFFRQAVS